MSVASGMPTFMVIGAARSGTTALYTYLRQHPDVFMSEPKEPNFFAFAGEPLDFQGPGAEFVNHSVATLEAYRRLFASARSHAARGEASPLYLFSPAAAERIRAAVPAVRLIAVLRNPVEQAYSHYLYARREMIEPLEDFEQALAAEPERLRAHWQPLFQYTAFARYGEQLARYRAHFARDQLRVFLYEEFAADPHAVLRDIFRFIGVRDDFVADVRARPNAGGVPNNPRLQWMVTRPHAAARLAGLVLPRHTRRWLRNVLSRSNVRRPAMPEGARQRLRAALRPDIIACQALLGRDLSAWLG